MSSATCPDGRVARSESVSSRTQCSSSPDAIFSLALALSLRAASACTSSGSRDVHDAYLGEVFVRCLCTAQESVRTICGGEKAAVSLRDVRRCIKVK